MVDPLGFGLALPNTSLFVAVKVRGAILGETEVIPKEFDAKPAPMSELKFFRL